MPSHEQSQTIEEEVKQHLAEAERNKQLNAQLQKDKNFDALLQDKLNQTHTA